jgi:hypothetical protein
VPTLAGVLVLYSHLLFDINVVLGKILSLQLQHVVRRLLYQVPVLVVRAHACAARASPHALNPGQDSNMPRRLRAIARRCRFGTAGLGFVLVGFATGLGFAWLGQRLAAPARTALLPLAFWLPTPLPSSTPCGGRSGKRLLFMRDDTP